MKTFKQKKGIAIVGMALVASAAFAWLWTKNKEADVLNVYDVLIVDESGSMGLLHDATIEGVDSTLKLIKDVQESNKKSQKHNVSLVLFSTMYDKNTNVVFDRMPTDSIGKKWEFNPGGGTPLYDAVGQTIEMIDEMVKTDENAVVAVTILSDGIENASRKFTADSLKTLVTKKIEKGWNFAYMGTAHDVKQAALTIGITNTMEFNYNNAEARNAWQQEASARSGYYEKLNGARFISGEAREDSLKKYSRGYYNR